MIRILVGILGYGERPPDLAHLITVCNAESITAMLVTWHHPGVRTKAALRRLMISAANADVEITEDNPGSAGGYARLLDRAATSGPWDYLLLLDDDLSIAPATIDRLVAAAGASQHRNDLLVMAYRPGLSELNALVVHGRHLRETRPGTCIGFHLLNFSGIGASRSSRFDGGNIFIETAPYGGLLIPKQCLPRLGQPIQRMFLYADDTEWTLRFTRGGGRIRLAIDAPVVDRAPSWNATSTAGGNLARRVLHLDDTKAYFEARNRNFLARKYYPGRKFVYAINRLIFLAATYLLAVANGKLARARLIHQAINDGETMARQPSGSWPSPPPGLD